MLVSRWVFDLLVGIAATPALFGVWMLVRERSSRVERWLGLVPLGAGIGFAAMFSSLGHPVVIATEVDHVVQYAHRIDLGAVEAGTSIENRTEHPLVVLETLDAHTYRELAHVSARGSNVCACEIDGDRVFVSTVRHP
ncbi:MAG TPA: hypothetical protein VL463_13780 [Kofleriaceae bacterium]|nr:hypothetical protein [Kofleriaceae bacterium]